jgi:hypothetical protein
LGVVHDLYLIGGGRRTPGAGHWAAGLRRWPGNRSGEWETAERRRWSGCAGRSPVAGLAKLPGKERGNKWLGGNRLHSVVDRIWCYSVGRGKDRKVGKACVSAGEK